MWPHFMQCQAFGFRVSYSSILGAALRKVGPNTCAAPWLLHIPRPRIFQGHGPVPPPFSFSKFTKKDLKLNIGNVNFKNCFVKINLYFLRVAIWLQSNFSEYFFLILYGASILIHTLETLCLTPTSKHLLHHIIWNSESEFLSSLHLIILCWITSHV